MLCPGARSPVRAVGVVCAAAPALRYPGGAAWRPAAGARVPAAGVLARRRLGVGGCGALAARFALVRICNYLQPTRHNHSLVLSANLQQILITYASLPVLHANSATQRTD